MKCPRSDIRPTVKPMCECSVCVLHLHEYLGDSPGLELGICWPQSSLKEYNIGRPMNGSLMRASGGMHTFSPDPKWC